MERCGGWVSLTHCCGLLVLGLWLQTAASTVRVDSVDAGLRGTDGTSPCLGENCNYGNHNSNKIRRILQGADDDDSFLHPRFPVHRPRRSSPRRARRQSVVVEVDEEVDAGGSKSHRLPCTRQEERQAACLNGQCYAVDLGHLRTPSCQCPEKYEGKRCELLSTYYIMKYYARLEKGAIIGGVVVGIILLIVAASVFCSYRKGRRKRNKPLCCCAGGTATSKRETAAMVPNGTDTTTAV